MQKLFDRCACGKVIPRENLKMAHSGKVSYTATLCEDCEKTYKDAARIVCRSCKRLQGFMEPTTCKDGFEYAKGGHYHITGCPQCRENLYHTPVEEHDEWLRARRMVAKPDLDLIQEIEQKALRGAREVARVRSDLQG